VPRVREQTHAAHQAALGLQHAPVRGKEGVGQVEDDARGGMKGAVARRTLRERPAELDAHERLSRVQLYVIHAVHRVELDCGGEEKLEHGVRRRCRSRSVP
jgi:hypothetical protein